MTEEALKFYSNIFSIIWVLKHSDTPNFRGLQCTYVYNTYSVCSLNIFSDTWLLSTSSETVDTLSYLVQTVVCFFPGKKIFKWSGNMKYYLKAKYLIMSFFIRIWHFWLFKPKNTMYDIFCAQYTSFTFFFYIFVLTVQLQNYFNVIF